ncbi:MAG: hypothetical protein ACYDBV_08970 [Nitrospiria bacterium]
MLKLFSTLMVWTLFLIFPLTCYATREFKVYPAQTAVEGELEVSYWNNFTFSNPQPYDFNGNFISKTGLMEHTLELEYGITERLTVEGYLDFEQPKGESFQYVQTRAVLARYHLFTEDEKFFNTSFYIEYGLPQERYNPSEGIDFRVMLEKSIQRWTIRLNPILTKTTSGPGVSDGVGFEYAAGIYWRNFHHVVPGLEFFGELGEIRTTPTHIHYIFPGFEINFGTGWKLESGVGFGLTDESDRMIIKNIISYSKFF